MDGGGAWGNAAGAVRPPLVAAAGRLGDELTVSKLTALTWLVLWEVTASPASSVLPRLASTTLEFGIAVQVMPSGDV
jgi:hypothetical protein